ncbi:hypothetical protein Pla52o_57340 [Novipirellula galeiformis]|uniref:Uncharacterized protein n=1 Tax=Novipirellula galeiformis TaxID=2528004 RepID=A0A5C6BE10_9BACT|nr:hypothetical protein [Novipirellula galeiformis]TWU10278.1 hypothetical protein Pla52o_57340 [Novipirellula galeiformis]
MSDDSLAFRLRHARRFHLQRLYHRNSTRFVITLLIATFAITLLALCAAFTFYAFGLTSESNGAGLAGGRLLGAFVVTFGAGPALWLIVHTYRPKLDFYAGSIYVNDWSQSRSVAHADVGEIRVSSNGNGASISIPNLGIDDLSIDRPVGDVADQIEALGLCVTRNVGPS